MWHFNSPKAYLVAACAACCWAGIHGAINSLREEERARLVRPIPDAIDGHRFLSDESPGLTNRHVSVTEVVPGGDVIWESSGGRCPVYTFWVPLFQIPDVPTGHQQFVPLPPPDAEVSVSSPAADTNLNGDSGPPDAFDRLAERGIVIENARGEDQHHHGPAVLIAACHGIHTDADWEIITATEFDGLIWDDTVVPPEVLSQWSEAYPGVDFTSLKVLHLGQHFPTVETAQDNFRFGAALASLSAVFCLIIVSWNRLFRGASRQLRALQRPQEAADTDSSAERHARSDRIPNLLPGLPEVGFDAEFDADAVIWPTTAGFYIRVGDQMRAIRDTDVRGISFRSSVVDVDGDKVRRHSLGLRFDDAGIERHVPVELDVRIGNDDRVTPFRRRLEQSRADVMWEQLRHGEVIGGPGWTLSRTSLTALTTDDVETLRLDSILHAGWSGELFQVWPNGRDTPILELTAGDENIGVLACVLVRLLTEGPPTASPASAQEIVSSRTVESEYSRGSDASECQDPAVIQSFDDISAGMSDSPFHTPLPQHDPLGSVLSEFTQRNRVAMVCVGAALFAIYATYFTELPGSRNFRLLIGVIPLLLTAGICEFFPQFQDRLQHRVNGIRLVKGGVPGFRSTCDLLFADMGLFASRKVDHYMNGVYTSTWNELTFGPADLSRRLRFKMTYRHGDTDDSRSTHLRSDACEAVTETLRRRLLEYGSVAWTPRLTIHHDHLACHTALRRTPIRIALTDVADIDVIEGEMSLWYGSDQRRLTERADSDNFLPGLQVLTTLLPGHCIGTTTQMVSPGTC